MKVMVGICTCERDLLLQQILHRLVDLKLGDLAADDVRIVVVDNRPNEATRDVCRRAAAALPVALHYVAEPERGISFARNRAVAAALEHGDDLLAFIDDDDLPDPDWLWELVVRQRETGADVVMGNRVYVLPNETADSLRDRLRQDDATNDTFLWKSNGLPNRLSTCNVLLSRSILERLHAEGPVFDPVFALMGGGDADFFCRARRAGASFARAERSYIAFRVAADRATLRGLLRRKFKGGLSQGLLARRYLIGSSRATWLAAVAGRLLASIVVLPVNFLRAQRGSKTACKLMWAVGAFYGFAGGRYDYYAKK